MFISFNFIKVYLVHRIKNNYLKRKGQLTSTVRTWIYKTAKLPKVYKCDPLKLYTTQSPYVLYTKVVEVHFYY